MRKVTLRTTLTHIAVVCDDAALQPLLPQVIVANTKTILRKQLLRLIIESPPNVRLVRRQTSWNTAALQEEVIGWLREALQPFRDRYTPVLLMDAAPVHLASNVLRACVERSIHVIVVPAQMTWLLQPLGTRVFRLYKATFMRAFQTARTRTDTGHLTVAAFLQVVYSTIREVLQGRTWHHAFAACGYTMGQTDVSESVLSELELAQRPQVSSACPDEQQLQYIFPRNCTIPPRDLLEQAPAFLPDAPLPPPLESPPARPRFRIMQKTRSQDDFGWSAHATSSQVAPSQSPPGP